MFVDQHSSSTIGRVGVVLVWVGVAVWVGLGLGWFGFGLGWFGLVWVCVGLGLGWFGFGLVWVGVGLG